MALSLKLFISGEFKASGRAVSRLRHSLDRVFYDAYSMDVIDVAKQPELAEQNRIIATPTLVKEAPLPSYRIVGDISRTDQIMRNLGHVPPGEPQEKEDEERAAGLFNLVEMNTDGIVVVDKKGTVRFANTAADRLFGITPGGFVNRPFGFPLRVEGSTEIEVLRSGQEPVTVEMKVSEILWQESSNYLASLRDVTKRKNEEKERQQLVSELKEALANVKRLSGLLPVCASCKKIRDDEGHWNQMETYIEKYSDALFSHGICPECADSLYKNSKWYQKRRQTDG